MKVSVQSEVICARISVEERPALCGICLHFVLKRRNDNLGRLSTEKNGRSVNGRSVLILICVQLMFSSYDAAFCFSVMSLRYDAQH